MTARCTCPATRVTPVGSPVTFVRPRNGSSASSARRRPARCSSTACRSMPASTVSGPGTDARSVGTASRRSSSRASRVEGSSSRARAFPRRRARRLLDGKPPDGGRPDRRRRRLGAGPTERIALPGHLQVPDVVRLLPGPRLSRQRRSRPRTPGWGRGQERWAQYGDWSNLVGFRYSYFEQGWFPEMVRQFIERQLKRAGVPVGLVAVFFPLFLAEQAMTLDDPEFRNGYRSALSAFWQERESTWLWNEDKAGLNVKTPGERTRSGEQKHWTGRPSTPSRPRRGECGASRARGADVDRRGSRSD